MIEALWFGHVGCAATTSWKSRWQDVLGDLCVTATVKNPGFFRPLKGFLVPSDLDALLSPCSLECCHGAGKLGANFTECHSHVEGNFEFGHPPTVRASFINLGASPPVGFTWG